MASQEPIYSAKVKKIIEILKYQTREEAAKELNYKNWKSLDMYMRGRILFTIGSRDNTFRHKTGTRKIKKLIGIPHRIRC